MSKTLLEPRLRLSSTAYIMITCEGGREEYVMSQLKPIEGITEIQGIYGAYDIIIKIESPTVDSLRDAILLDVRKISGIRATTTIVCELPKMLTLS